MKGDDQHQRQAVHHRASQKPTPAEREIMPGLLSILGLVVLGLGLALAQPARADVCKDDNFTPVPENDTKTCKPLWEKVGLPTSGDDIDATPVCHTRYVLLHNNETR